VRRVPSRIPLDDKVDLLGIGTHPVFQGIVSAVEAHQQRPCRQAPRIGQDSIEHKAESQLAVFAPRLEIRTQAPALDAEVSGHHAIAVMTLVGIGDPLLLGA